MVCIVTPVGWMVEGQGNLRPRETVSACSLPHCGPASPLHWWPDLGDGSLSKRRSRPWVLAHSQSPQCFLMSYRDVMSEKARVREWGSIAFSSLRSLGGWLLHIWKCEAVFLYQCITDAGRITNTGLCTWRCCFTVFIPRKGGFRGKFPWLFHLKRNDPWHNWIYILYLSSPYIIQQFKNQILVSSEWYMKYRL